MSLNDNYDEKDDLTFMERHKVVLSVVAVVVIAVGVFILQGKFSKPSSSQRKGPDIVSIRLPAPPPTPPPPAPTPPPPQEVKEQKMVEQAPVDDKEEKPDDKPPESAPVTTSIVGNGPDAFGLKAGTGGSYLGGNGTAQQRSKWGWYAAQVQSTIADSLRKNPQIRSASLSLDVRIWPDITGRVTRAKLTKTTNDPKLDEAISATLVGLQLKEPPPQGMPSPIVLRITAQRPN